MELWAGEKREIVTDLKIPHYDSIGTGMGEGENRSTMGATGQGGKYPS